MAQGSLQLQYFQLLWRRNLAKAEEALEKVKEKMKGTEWELGYLNAMEGLLASAKSNDDRYLYSKRLPTGREAFSRARKRFQKSTRKYSALYTEFDRGYFRCWLDFLGAIEEALSTGLGEA